MNDNIATINPYNAEIETKIQTLKENISKGDIAAEQKLGDLYESLSHHAEAFKCYQNAANKGDSIAQHKVGTYYKKGKNGVVKKDLSLAFYWIHLAAQHFNNFNAQNDLAIFYEKGEGVECNLQTAIDWLERAAEGGNTTAQCNVAAIYYSKKFKKVPEHLRDIENLKSAIKWYQKAADKDVPKALYHLGRFYEKGIAGSGIPKDLKKALEYYQYAADKNNVKALYKVGMLYWEGKGGLPKDKLKALECLNRAATHKPSHKKAKKFINELCHEYSIKYYNESNKKSIPAEDKLLIGFFLEHGMGALSEGFMGYTKIPDKAIQYYQESALENIEAKFYLAKCYEKGNVVEQDLEKALGYYIKAAYDNHDGAKKYVYDLFQYAKPSTKNAATGALKVIFQIPETFYLLGNFYEQLGVDGRVDLDEAKKYYKQAADRGDAKAMYAYASLCEKSILYFMSKYYFNKLENSLNAFQENIDNAIEYYYRCYFKMPSHADQIITFFQKYPKIPKASSYLKEITEIEMDSHKRSVIFKDPVKSNVSKCFQFLSWSSDERVANHDNFKNFLERKSNLIGRILTEGAKELNSRSSVSETDVNSAILFCNNVPEHSIYYPVALETLIILKMKLKNTRESEINALREKLYEANKQYKISFRQLGSFENKKIDIQKIFNDNAAKLDLEEIEIESYYVSPKTSPRISPEHSPRESYSNASASTSFATDNMPIAVILNNFMTARGGALQRGVSVSLNTQNAQHLTSTTDTNRATL
jgi:TPR repeat protein